MKEMSAGEKEIKELGGAYKRGLVCGFNNSLNFKNGNNEGHKEEKRKVNKEKEENRMNEIKKKSPNVYKEWTDEEEEKLKEQFNKGASLEELAIILQMQVGGIKARLKRLGLIDFDMEGDNTTHKTLYKQKKQKIVRF